MNEAAERLRYTLSASRGRRRLLEEALAAERKAAIQRVRAALAQIALDLPGEDFRGVFAILDKEDTR